MLCVWNSGKLSVVQIEQDFAVCARKFPSLICRPVGAQFLEGGVIVLFEFERNAEAVRIGCERLYKLVPPEDLTEADLETYRQRAAE